jgi:hypothetical protein
LRPKNSTMSADIRLPTGWQMNAMLPAMKCTVLGIEATSWEMNLRLQTGRSFRIEWLRGSRDISVGMVSTLQAGRPRIRGSYPIKSKSIFPYPRHTDRL